jgi:DNA-binding XRE family transcriptional regulator
VPNLTEMRRIRNVSQVDLAVMVGTDQSHISRIERGIVEPGVCLANKIARVLNSTVEDLFGECEIATPDETPQDAPIAGDAVSTPIAGEIRAAGGDVTGNGGAVTAGENPLTGPEDC